MNMNYFFIFKNKKLNLERRSILLALLPFILFSCKDTPEQIPAYLYIKPFAAPTVSAEQGSASSKIAEAWVYTNGEFIGVYTMSDSFPAVVPTLETGDVEIQLFPGIHDNGISAVADIYPFYEKYVVRRTLAPGKFDTIKPTTKYVSDAQIDFIENFEAGSNFDNVLEGDPSLHKIVPSTVDVFEGKQSGVLTLTDANPLAQVACRNIISTIPQNNTPVYLELNFKSDVPLQLGLVGYNALGESTITYGDYVFKGKEKDGKPKWTKGYVNITSIVKSLALKKYQIVLGAQIPTDQTTGKHIYSEAKIWIDNVKLIHFK
jgi:hypothetical protein